MTAYATISDSSSGGTLTYQWYKSTSPTDTGSLISAATSSTYAPSSSPAGTAYYYCMATNTNNGVYGNKTATAKSSVYTVQVADFGYHISSTSPTPMDLRNRLGISRGGREGVVDTFTAVHKLIASPYDDFKTVLKVGDYIDLPYLNVQADYHQGDSMPIDLPSCAIALDANNAYLGGIDNDTILRIVIIGLDSYNGKNGNTTPHVVFQFKHVPVISRVDFYGSWLGFKWAQLGWYLNGNFLNGLANAGVPKAYLWNPTRVYAEMDNPTDLYWSYVSSYGAWENLHYFPGENPGNWRTMSMEIRPVARNGYDNFYFPYMVWMPSELEMFGTKTNSLIVETTADQANFTGYYKDNESRKKRGMASNHAEVEYWTSSISSKTGRFDMLQLDYPNDRWGWHKYVTVTATGTPSSAYQQIENVGVSPAFCIK
jgi:hypothetical protein